MVDPAHHVAVAIVQVIKTAAVNLLANQPRAAQVAGFQRAAVQLCHHVCAVPKVRGGGFCPVCLGHRFAMAQPIRPVGVHHALRVALRLHQLVVRVVGADVEAVFAVRVGRFYKVDASAHVFVCLGALPRFSRLVAVCVVGVLRCLGALVVCLCFRQQAVACVVGVNGAPARFAHLFHAKCRQLCAVAVRVVLIPQRAPAHVVFYRQAAKAVVGVLHLAARPALAALVAVRVGKRCAVAVCVVGVGGNHRVAAFHRLQAVCLSYLFKPHQITHFQFHKIHEFAIPVKVRINGEFFTLSNNGNLVVGLVYLDSLNIVPFYGFGDWNKAIVVQ